MSRPKPALKLRRVAAVCVVAVAVSMSPTVGDEVPSVPEMVYKIEDSTLPVWLRADVAVSSSGEINDQIRASGRQVLETLFEREPQQDPEDPGSECVLAEEWVWENVGPDHRSTLEETLQRSRMVLHGRVMSKAYGVTTNGEPGQIVVVEPLSFLKSGPTNLPYYYLFYPVGTFDLGPHRICKLDYRYPPAPELGSDLVIMVPPLPPPSSSEAYLSYVDARDLLLFDGSGVAQHGDFHDSDPAVAAALSGDLSREDALQLLKSLLKKGSQ